MLCEKTSVWKKLKNQLSRNYMRCSDCVTCHDCECLMYTIGLSSSRMVRKSTKLSLVFFH